MPDAKITYSDGTVVVFSDVPEDVPPASILERARNVRPDLKVMKVEGGAASDQPTGFEGSLGRIARFGKLAGSAAVRGAVGMPALAADVINLPVRGVKKLTSDTMADEPYMPATDAVSKFGTQPQDNQEVMLARMFEAGTPGALTAKMPGLVGGLVEGAVSGAAENVFGDNPLVTVPLSLAGGYAGARTTQKYQGYNPRVSRLAREGMEGITQEQLDQAMAMQEQAAKMDVQLDLVQALTAVGASPGNMRMLRDTLAQSQYGNRTQAFLRNQNTQLEVAGGELISSMPGDQVSIGDAANAVQKAATGTLEGLKKDRTQLWRDVYANGVQAMRAAEGPKVLAARADVQAARKELADAQAILKRAFQGDTSAIRQADAAAQQSLEALRKLREFSLPRGRAIDNRGNLLNTPERGGSIQSDQMPREALGGLGVSTDPMAGAFVPPGGKSLEVTGAEQRVAMARQRKGQAEAGARAAVQGFREITQVNPQTVANIAYGLQKRANARPNTPLGDALNQLARDMFDANNNPITDGEALNEILKAHATRLKGLDLNSKGMDIGTVKAIASTIQSVRDRLGKAFGPYKQANQAYSTFTSEVYNPVKQSVTGRMAGRGYRDDTQAPAARLEALFERGRSPQSNRRSDVITLANDLKKTDPTAFPNAAKTWLADRLGRALEPTLVPDIAGVQPPASPEKTAEAIYQALFATQNKMQGVKDIMVGVAKSYDMSPDDLIRGVENYALLVKAIRDRPARTSGLSFEDIQRIGGRSLTSDVMSVPSWSVWARAGRRLEERQLANTMKKLDELMTSAEGARLLQKVGRQGGWRPETLLLLGQLTGAVQVNSGQELQQE